jgi:hypothetical protein
MITRNYDNNRISVTMSEEQMQTIPPTNYTRPKKIMCSTCEAGATHRVDEDKGEILVRSYYCRSCFNQLAAA